MICFIQETVNTLVGSPREGAVESTIINAVQWLRLIVETTGAVIIGLSSWVVSCFAGMSRFESRAELTWR